MTNILHGLIVMGALAVYLTAFTVVLCKAADAAAADNGEER